jgi:hypothetical protein
MLNRDFEILLNLIKRIKSEDKKDEIAKLIVSCINKNSRNDTEETLKMRDSEEYRKYITILIENLSHMIEKADLLYIFNENGDKELEDLFKNITDKQEFVKDFVVFNK